jgi:hypothetical protein
MATHPLYTPEFLAFWSAYPRRVGKADAAKAWHRERPDLDEVLTALSWQRSQPQWCRDGGQFVPHPSTYLNQRRWEDEPYEPAVDLTPHRGDTLGAHTAKLMLSGRQQRQHDDAPAARLLSLAFGGEKDGTHD